MDELHAAVREAIETLTTETGLDVDALFGERVLEVSDMSATAAYAAGVIEGAALALGLTAIELIDQIER